MGKKRELLPTPYALEIQRKTELAATQAVQGYCDGAFSAGVGEAIVGVHLDGGVLTVNCSGAALVQELEQFHRVELLAAVRSVAPGVARIVVRPA
ncbi:MAG TPA: hypothetical protein VL860_14035 [Planctomycetota bacterium]|nr:hypothetical protein [Planctomycetota bacterium]